MTEADPFPAGLAPSFTRDLLESLVQGGGGLPSARERWVTLLTDPSPEIRLKAEAILLEALRNIERPSSRSIDLRPAELLAPYEIPERAPRRREPSEPWRHCRTCFGHDFWFNRAGEIFCRACAPPRSNVPSEPWRFCRACGGTEFWFEKRGAPNCVHCVPPAPAGTAM